MTPGHAPAPPFDAYSVLLKFLYRAPVAMVQTDLEGRIELMTPVAANCLMPLSTDGTLDNLFTVLEPRLPGLAERALQTHATAGTVCERWRFAVLLPRRQVYELDGRHVGGDRLHWTLRDVTADVESRESERSVLVHQIRRLASDLDHALSLSGIVILRTALPRADAEGDPPDALSAFQARIRTESRPAFLEDLRSAQLRGGGVIRKFAVDAPQGVRWMIGRHAIDHEDGRAVGLVTFCLDVTEEHESAAAREARHAAETASAAKSDFLLGVSHELRTPLNGVLGLSEALLRSTQQALAPAQRELVSKIHGAGIHLARLLDDLLDVSAIEQGRIAVRRENVDIGTIVEAAVDAVQPLAQQRQVTVRRGASGADCHALADPTRLRQVLINLLSNAIKYNRAGGSVDIHAEARGAGPVVVVRDTGFGMTADQVTGLFTPFNRVGREHSAVRGMGVGLYLSRRLLEAMEGRISVTSVPEQGSTFTVELAPGVQPEPPAPSPPVAPPDQMAGRAAVVDMLCVDDNPINLVVFECIVADREDFRLRTSVLGSQFLEEARSQVPDIAVVDLELPDMSGWQIIDALQADASLRRIPVIISSATILSSEDLRRLEAAGHAFIEKPVEAERFMREVDRLLALRAGHRPEAGRA